MLNGKQLKRKETTVGDAAVDGLLAGVVAGIVMAAYLVAIGVVTGEGPATVLARFAPGAGASPMTGALVHLAESAVYGALFGVGWRLVGRRRPHRLLTGLAGLAYGVLLLLVAKAIILPGTASPLREIPFVHFAVAHGVYGLVLGFLTGRQQQA
ncbi:MAG: hypothetical protein ACE5LU_30080 [Anaerolineae bacterium]